MVPGSGRPGRRRIISGRREGKAYLILYSTRCEAHLQALSAYHRSLALDEVEDQLSFEPTVETKNRKRLRNNPFARWELRIDKLRVYHNGSDAPQMSVSVIAMAIKERDRAYLVGGEALEL